MEELAKALKDFIARDVIFILGGGSVVLAFLHLANRLPTGNLPIPAYLFGAGVAYVIGYLIQDGMSVVGIVTTAPVVKPPCPIRKVYERFTRVSWKNLEEDYLTGEVLLRERASERTFSHYQRIVTLMQIGTTMGTCWSVAGLVILCRYWYRGWERFDAVVGVVLMLAGAILILLGWIKALQCTRFVLSYQPLSTVTNDGKEASNEALQRTGDAGL